MCRYWSPRAGKPRFSRDASFCGRLKTETGSEKGAFESFAVKTGKGTHKSAARPVVAYAPEPLGQIRQRRLQRILDNLGDCRRMGRNGSSPRRSEVVRSRGAVEGGWSR